MRIKFDQIVRTDKGIIMGVKILRRGEHAGVRIEEGKNIDINTLHKTLGHVNEDIIRKTAAYYKVKVQD